MKKINQKPNNWKEVSLGDTDYFEILPSGINKFGGIKKYLSTSSVQGDKIISIESEITFDDRPSRANMQPVLSSVWFAKMKDTFKILEIRSEDLTKNYILSTGFAGIVIKDGNSSFLKQIVLSDNFNSQKNLMAKGSTQKAINTEGIKKIKFLLPPLNEQKKIAEVLGSVDENIEKTEQIISKTEELKKGLMQKFFSEKGKRKKEKIKFKEIAEFKNGINFSKDQKGENGKLTIDVLNMYGDSVYVDTKNLYRVDINNKKDYELKDNDILFVRSSVKKEGVGWTSLFKKYTEPVLFCGFIIRARLKNKKNINPKFLVYYFRSDKIRNKLISGSGQVGITNINQETLSNIGIYLPILQEQKQIANILSAVDDKIDIYKQIKNKLTELKKGLMQDLLSGKVRVN